MYVDEVQALAKKAFDELHQNAYYKTKWQPSNKNVAATIDAYFANGGTPPPTDTANHFANALAAVAVIYRAMVDYDCAAPKEVYE